MRIEYPRPPIVAIYVRGVVKRLLRIGTAALILAVALFAAACVPPTVAPPEASEISVTRAGVERLVGQHVHWGGEIASVTPTEHETCFEVIDRPLTHDGKPLDGAQSDGRFLACTPQFYARGVYEGQDVTVAGTLELPVTAKLDDLKYRYPRVAIATLHFWPRSEDSLASHDFPRWWQPWDPEVEFYWW